MASSFEIVAILELWCEEVYLLLFVGCCGKEWATTRPFRWWVSLADVLR